MADKFFVDTNILIYAHDRSGVEGRAAKRKHDRARLLVEDLWSSGKGVVSTQVLQELCVNLRRKVARPFPYDEIRGLIHDYMSWEVVTHSPQAVIQALEIEARFQTSFWDALILQAAERAGVKFLYSEHLATRQNYGTVQVLNPLGD